jgi:MoaA/NifB/PqqE/SkfB family radical SAM enzyme
VAYDYNSTLPIQVSPDQLTEQELDLLTKSRTFCIYPWIHLHAYPTGEAWPCCHAEMKHGAFGDSKKSTLSEIWNDRPMRELRQHMLKGQSHAACTRCYEQEKSGFFSGRQSANKHHGHHINRVHDTHQDGSVPDFKMTYWDIRFSNLCNLRCRSCGHIFSSQWYQDQARLAGPEWKAQNKPLNYAGRTETDIWEQLIPHLDYVEQIYFAGGEPLLMEEHYRILEELEQRGRFDVRLIYNTNFTEVRLRDRLVFDYWKRFKNVAVGASLDAMGTRAEYIRKGTKWTQVEENRRRMLEICPQVDFYISPTLSIMNAWHLPEFHREWVEQGLIRPQDLNVNILQDPSYLRIDIAPRDYKNRIQKRFEQHLEWLRPLDQLRRAVVGFESALNFMQSTDNTALIPQFWERTRQLDNIRSEHCLDFLPELKALK